MTKRRPTAPPAPDALSFTPVPVRPRHDGWTPVRQVDFIKALAASGCVAAAARSVGMSTQTAYDLYNRPDAGSLRQAWHAAADQATVRLADETFSRALNGVANPIFYKGEQIGERRRYDERLAMWLLRHLAPDRFGAWRDGFQFRREDPDGLAKTLQYALESLVDDLVADAAEKPRRPRDPVLRERFVSESEASEKEQKARDAMYEIRQRIEQQAMEDRLARIRRGDFDPVKPDEPDGDVAAGSSG